MTKKEVIEAMAKKLDDMDMAEKEEISAHPSEPASNIIKLRDKYCDAALKIAEDNGYTGECKWQLWDAMVTLRERKFGVRPDCSPYARL